MKKNMLLNLILVLVVVCGSLACGKSSKKSARGTRNGRDSDSVCSYLEEIGFEANENAQFSTDHTCFSTNPEGVIYTVTGVDDKVRNLELAGSADSANQGVAEKMDESIAKATGEIWQRLFAQPLPGEITEAILTSKGKSVAVKKFFARPAMLTVERYGIEAGKYGLRVSLTMPEEIETSEVKTVSGDGNSNP
jgi:hypothetical protein